MNNKTDIDVQYVTPFKKFCMTIGELPTSYLETMSYYEMLIWFTEFLKNQVIPTVNNNAEAVEELQSLYEELRTYVNDYFDNLDVQDEINNKLDDMLESGQLEQIIEQYLQSSALWCFDTVADMKLATNLINGSYAKTLGYYSANDNGSALYKIRTITNLDVVNESTIIALSDNTLVAELIIDENLNSKQLGVYGDEMHDDTQKLQNAINLNKKICLIGNIKITDSITVDVGLHKGIKGTVGTKILADFTNEDYNIFNLVNSLHTELGEGPKGTVNQFYIDTLIFNDINGTDTTLDTHHGNGIYLGNGSCTLEIKNCVFENLVHGLYSDENSESVYNNKITNCYFKHNDYGAYIGCSGSNDCGENFRFLNCILGTSKYGNFINIDMGVNFVECSLDYNLENTLIIKDGATVCLSNCHIEWYSSTPVFDVRNNSSLILNGCNLIRTNYDDGGTNDYFINSTITGDSVPSIIFNDCTIYITRAYTNLTNAGAYIKFENCRRHEYNPSNYCNPPLVLNLTECNNYIYPLNYNSGLTRNTTRVKVTCTSVKSGNALTLPFEYNNEDGRIILNVKSSIDLNFTVDVGNGLFGGEGVLFSSGEQTSSHSVTANTETNIVIYHKFRKGLDTKPYIRIHLGNLTEGATFEVLSMSVQLI